MSDSDTEDALRLTLWPPGGWRSTAAETSAISGTTSARHGGGTAGAVCYYDTDSGGTAAVQLSDPVDPSMDELMLSVYNHHNHYNTNTSSSYNNGRGGTCVSHNNSNNMQMQAMMTRLPSPTATATAPTTTTPPMTSSRRSRGSATAKEDRIPPPYPWATDRRAVVKTVSELAAQGINRIAGEVSCKKCGTHVMEVELQSALYRVSSFFIAHRGNMHDRAPRQWTTPSLLTCSLCQQCDHARPLVSPKKRSINWLFLLLTQTLGICTLEQLKYFCKHTRKHRTGAKDRVLYLTYAGLLKQLNPSGPFD